MLYLDLTANLLSDYECELLVRLRVYLSAPLYASSQFVYGCNYQLCLIKLGVQSMVRAFRTTITVDVTGIATYVENFIGDIV